MQVLSLPLPQVPAPAPWEASPSSNSAAASYHRPAKVLVWKKVSAGSPDSEDLEQAVIEFQNRADAEFPGARQVPSVDALLDASCCGTRN